MWGIKPDWKTHHENKKNKEETINLEIEKFTARELEESSSVYESLTEERKCQMVPFQIVIS